MKWLERIANAKVAEIQAPRDNLLLKQQEVDPDWYIACGSGYCVWVRKASTVTLDQQNHQLQPVPQVA